MKLSKILPFCIVAVLMSGCSPAQPDDTNDVNSINVLTSEEAATIMKTDTEIRSETANADTKDNTEETTAAEIVSLEYMPSEEEQEQIQKLLCESKDFFYGYIDCKEIVKHKSSRSTATTEIHDNGMLEGEIYEKNWYEIIDGEVMTLTDLNEKMEKLFTDTMIENLQNIIDYTYYEENGKLYLSEFSGNDGSLLGIDTVHIVSVGKIDENTLVLCMNAFGAGENWDIDFDASEDFMVILKRTDNGFKVEECSDTARMYITWCYIPEDDIFS